MSPSRTTEEVTAASIAREQSPTRIQDNNEVARLSPDSSSGLLDRFSPTRPPLLQGCCGDGLWSRTVTPRTAAPSPAPALDQPSLLTCQFTRKQLPADLEKPPPVPMLANAPTMNPRAEVVTRAQVDGDPLFDSIEEEEEAHKTEARLALEDRFKAFQAVHRLRRTRGFDSVLYWCTLKQIQLILERIDLNELSRAAATHRSGIRADENGSSVQEKEGLGLSQSAGRLSTSSPPCPRKTPY